MFSLQIHTFFFQTSAFPWNRERKSSRLWRDNVSSHHLPPVSPFLFPSHRRPLSVVELNEHEPRFPPKITTPRPFRLWASPTETFHLAYYPLSSISLFPNKLMGSWNKVIKLWKKKNKIPSHCIQPWSQSKGRMSHSPNTAGFRLFWQRYFNDSISFPSAISLRALRYSWSALIFLLSRGDVGCHLTSCSRVNTQPLRSPTQPRKGFLCHMSKGKSWGREVQAKKPH